MSKRLELLRSVDQSRLAAKEEANGLAAPAAPAARPVFSASSAAYARSRGTSGWVQTLAFSLAIIILISLNIVLALDLRSSASQIAGLNEKLADLRATVLSNAENAAPLAADVKSISGSIAQLQSDIRGVREETANAGKSFQQTAMNITELQEKYQLIARDIRDLKLMNNIVERYKAPQPKKREGGY